MAADLDTARANALDAFLKTMDKEKPGEVRALSDTSAGDVSAISTGAISLDVALSAGGFPRGRIIELYGPEMSGKTSLALSVAAQCQAEGGNVGFVDAEHALSRDHVRDMGCDPDRLVLYQPSSGEDGLNMVDKMCQSAAFDIVIIDSVAALVPQAELDGDMEDQLVGTHARMMSKAMRKLTHIAKESDTMLIFVNQIREKIGAYGNPETTTGGRALKFYASVRVEVRSAASKKISQGSTVIGQEVHCKITKNKVGAPHTIAQFDLLFGKGIQSAGSLLQVCEDLGIIQRNGGSYTEVETGERIAIGKDKVKAVIAEDPALEARLTAGVYAALRGEGPTAPAAAADAGDDADVDFDAEDAVA